MGSTYRDGESDLRPWGQWEVLGSATDHVVKRIVVTPGKRLSLQRHTHRSEHWVIVQGLGRITLGDAARLIGVGDYVFIPCGELHRIENIGTVDLVFIEVQTGSLLSEDDIERIADDAGRV